MANDAPSWLRRDPGQFRPRPPSARTQLRAARANRRPRKPSRPLGLVQNVRALTHPFTKHLAHSPTCDRRAGGARVWPANTALILPTRRSVGRNGAFLACFWLATARCIPSLGAEPLLARLPPIEARADRARVLEYRVRRPSQLGVRHIDSPLASWSRPSAPRRGAGYVDNVAKPHKMRDVRAGRSRGTLLEPLNTLEVAVKCNGPRAGLGRGAKVRLYTLTTLVL